MQWVHALGMKAGIEITATTDDRLWLEAIIGDRNILPKPVGRARALIAPADQVRPMTQDYRRHADAGIRPPARSSRPEITQRPSFVSPRRPPPSEIAESHHVSKVQ